MSVSDSDFSDGSLNSMQHINASELFPRRSSSEMHDLNTVSSPFSPLCGESIQFIAQISEGVLTLTNYRICYQKTGKDGKGDFSIPLGLIDTVEMKDLYLSIVCKNARTYRCSFPASDICNQWLNWLQKATVPPKKVTELFAFAFYKTANEESSEVLSCLGRDLNFTTDYFRSEVRRLKYETENTSWRVSYINVEYKLCPSYPKYLIVPASITDSVLQESANFRSSYRVPTVIWRHKENGTVLARSSQPHYGWLGWRSTEDENLLKALSDSCPLNKDKKLLVIDARSYASAMANRTRGGGFEFSDYYCNCEVQFMNLANIHTIRKCFQSLKQLCGLPPDITNWHSLLEGTKWLSHMSLLIMTAVRVVKSLEKELNPVLVHCSDGWDRTTQIVSLAELLIDPYYRTMEGFQVLCEREWLDFGHKFADRCGITEELTERCPVFLQWLDCVHNILEQFPCAFEFSKRYLIKLAEHTYSNLFGTFLCNTNVERQSRNIAEQTFSVWRYLNSMQFKNYLYNPNHEKVLWPKYNVRDLLFWRDLYIDLAYDNQYLKNSTESNTENNEANTTEKDKLKIKTEHMPGIVVSGNLNNLGNNVDSMLESAINCQPDEVINENVVTSNSETADIDGESDSTNADVLSHGLSSLAIAIDEASTTITETTVTPTAMIAKSLKNESPNDMNDLINDVDGDSLKFACDSEKKRSSVPVETDMNVRLPETSSLSADKNDYIDTNLTNYDSNDVDGDNINTATTLNDNKVQRDDNNVFCDIFMNNNANSSSNNNDNNNINNNSNNNNNDNSNIENTVDCDVILSNCSSRNVVVTNTNIPEDCNNKIVDELDVRLNINHSGDISIQTSVETIVDSNFAVGSLINEINDHKTVTNGHKQNDTTAFPILGRQQITSRVLDPVDGLPVIPDDIQDRLQELSIEQKAQEAALRSELHTTRSALMNKICNQCNHQSPNPSDKQVISDDDKGSVCSTEISWEAVDERDVGQILWVPDYAVNYCTSCNVRFWLGRRRHHCRSCGKIFCNDCSPNMTALPNEQLFDPVRVCEECYNKRVSPPMLTSYCTSPKQQTTCKQAAAGEKQQNSNLVLRTAPRI